MSNPWPVNYRNREPSRKLPGYQGSSPTILPTPSNSNFRVPLSANDEVPGVKAPPRMLPKGRIPFAGIAGRSLLRAAPLVGLGLSIAEWYMRQGQPGLNVPSGWEKVRDCGGKEDYARDLYGHTCDGAEWLIDDRDDIRVSIADNSPFFHTWQFSRFRFGDPAERMWAFPGSMYRRIDADAPNPEWMPDTGAKPAAMPSSSPSVYTVPWQPTVDPFSIPVAKPAPTPAPIPWHVLPNVQPNPYRSPEEQPQRGNDAPWGRPAFPNWPQELPLPGSQPSAPGAPAVGPTIEFNPTPGTYTPPVVRPAPDAPPHQPGPPGRREKERKTIIAVGGKIAQVMNIVTESLDFANALYKALPRQYRPGYYPIHDRNGNIKWVKRWNASQWQRLKAVYEHADMIDLQKAFEEVQKNNIEDSLWGGLGQVTKTANRKLGQRFGLGIHDQMMGDAGISFGIWPNG